MRALFLAFMAICIVSASALAGFDRVGPDRPGHESADTVVFELVDGAGPAGVIDGSPLTECPCKETSGSLNFSCGITLALADEDSYALVHSGKQAWFAFKNTGRDAHLPYLLKRPPRTIL